MKHIEVRLSLLIGNRKLCALMSNAGLGLTGVGSREIYVLTYAQGEVVDAARVETAVNKIKEQMDRDNDEFTILSHEILSIKEVE